jgi:transcriptional repressor NrdR
VLDNPRDEANIAAVRAKVAALTRALPGLSLTRTRPCARPPAPDRRRECAAPSAATPKPRSSRPASRTTADVHPPSAPLRLKCDKRFTTYERPEVNCRPSSRRTAGASSSTAQAARLHAGAAQAPGQHRAGRRAIERIEEKLLASACAKCRRPHRRTGDARAQALDKVAYVRFASVYRSFEDVDEFSQ